MLSVFFFLSFSKLASTSCCSEAPACVSQATSAVIKVFNAAEQWAVSRVCTTFSSVKTEQLRWSNQNLHNRYIHTGGKKLLLQIKTTLLGRHIVASKVCTLPSPHTVHCSATFSICMDTCWCGQCVEKLISGRPHALGVELIKTAVKETFHWPSGKLDSSVPDGGSSAWQTYRRAEPGERLGTGRGAGILVERWLAPRPSWPL